MNNRRLYSLKVKRVVFKQALGIRTCELSNTWKLSPRSSLRSCLLLYCIASASTVPARSYSNASSVSPLAYIARRTSRLSRKTSLELFSKLLQQKRFRIGLFLMVIIAPSPRDFLGHSLSLEDWIGDSNSVTRSSSELLRVSAWLGSTMMCILQSCETNRDRSLAIQISTFEGYYSDSLFSSHSLS